MICFGRAFCSDVFAWLVHPGHESWLVIGISCESLYWPTCAFMVKRHWVLLVVFSIGLSENEFSPSASIDRDTGKIFSGISSPKQLRLAVARIGSFSVFVIVTRCVSGVLVRPLNSRLSGLIVMKSLAIVVIMHCSKFLNPSLVTLTPISPRPVGVILNLYFPSSAVCSFGSFPLNGDASHS